MNIPNDGEHIHTGAGRVIAALVVACFTLLMIAAPSAFGAQQVITSAGPLTNIFLNDNLACNANHTDDTSPEFFGGTDPGACGTFLHTGDTVYGPDVPFGNPRTPYGLVSQSAVTGSGTSADPFQVATVVDAGTTGLRITQTDSYVVGDEFYTTDIVVSNSTGSDITAALYHAADCFLQDSDEGNGFFDSSSGGIYCSTNVDNEPEDRIEGFVPLSSGSNYVEIDWPTIWDLIDGTQFPNTCDCTTFQDNGAGLSWSITVPANGSVTRSLLTAFSPTGETPPADGVGDVSARGTDPDAEILAETPVTVAASYSAITNCDEAQSTRPFYVRWTEGTTSHLFKKDAGAATTSTCVDESGVKVNEGTATGLIDGTTAATVEWSFVDGVPSPDNVDITVTPAGGDLLNISGAPETLNGSPGGVWARETSPWPAGGGA